MKKKFVLLSLLLFGLLLPSSLFAQEELSKQEIKQLKAELKGYKKDPQKFKAFKQQIENAKADLNRLLTEYAQNQKIIEQKQEELDAKNAEIETLLKERTALKTRVENTQKNINNQTNIKGVVYKVQISMTAEDLYTGISEEDGEVREFFSGDTAPDGSKKYTLGYFPTQEEAVEFQKALKKLRISNTEINAYKDGEFMQGGGE